MKTIATTPASYAKWRRFLTRYSVTRSTFDCRGFGKRRGRPWQNLPRSKPIPKSGTKLAPAGSRAEIRRSIERAGIAVYAQPACCGGSVSILPVLASQKRTIFGKTCAREDLRTEWSRVSRRSRGQCSDTGSPERCILIISPKCALPPSTAFA